MFLGAYEPNDCEVMIKGGKFVITGVTRCSHGNVINQMTMSFSLELADKLRIVINHDKMDGPSKSRWNQNRN
jgi:hypothetical protein